MDFRGASPSGEDLIVVRIEKSSQIVRWCLLGFAPIWLACAINPVNRGAWLLENLAFVLIPIAVFLDRRSPFSTRSWVQFSVLSVLHVIGSHYTYERMPVGTWLRDTFDLSRNPYDRVVHCLYGFLIFLPVREVLFRRARLGMAKELFVAFCIVSTGSMLYELVEWFVAVIVDPRAGPAFLAMQGDEWDSQKDMAVAAGGSIVAAGVEWWIDHRHRARQP